MGMRNRKVKLAAIGKAKKGKAAISLSFFPRFCRGDKKFFLLFLVLGGDFVYAQIPPANPWWYTMEQGKSYFRKGDYGKALLSFEDARRQRQSMYAAMEQDLINFLSIPEVRRLGDSLSLLETYIANRGELSAAAALRELYYRVPKDSLNDSAERALAELSRLKNYPEAEYWIGETYRAEGELGVALGQFEKAYSQRDTLENSGFDLDLLYKIADVNRIRHEYTKMERELLEIVEGAARDGSPRDILWAGTGGAQRFARSAMARILENDGIGRFLTMYRYNNTGVEWAHRLLGLYYFATGRQSPGPAKEHLIFAFLIQSTVLLEEITRSRFDYAFTDLESLLEEVKRRPSLLSYLEECEYYKTVYYLGNAFYGDGNVRTAREFWTFLAGQEAAGEWRGRARAQLQSPFVERAVENP
jgi:tetratricopeptide (TPR) repeat protein